MDRREARLARTEQRLSMAFGAAHSRAYQAGVSLRHLVRLLAGGEGVPGQWPLRRGARAWEDSTIAEGGAAFPQHTPCPD